MSLLGNYSVILTNPATFIGGTQVSNCRNAFNASGQLKQRFYPETIDGLPLTTALPEGYLSPNAWVLPYELGSMSISTLNGSSSLTAIGTSGLGGELSISGSSVFNATGGLLAGLILNISGSSSMSLLGGGLIEAFLTIAGTSEFSAAISANAGMTLTMNGIGTMTLSPQATGEMVLDIYVNQAQATVDQIVAAVWSALAAEFNESGTMGQKLNGAGSAGDPWTADLSTYNTDNTAGKILKQAKKAAKDAATLSA